MRITSTQSIPSVYTDVLQELKRAKNDKHHAFRYVCMATTGSAEIGLRYVVLRSVNDQLDMEFFTDYRTQKIKQLKAIDQLSLLFYDPSKKVQVRVSGKATIHYQDEVAKDRWGRVDGPARKAYNSLISPGAIIDIPEDAHVWPEEMKDAYFTVIRVEAETMEVLQLNQLNHLRAYLTKKEGNWSGDWIAP